MSIDSFLFLALGGEELLPEEILVSEDADSLLCFEVRVNDVIGASHGTGTHSLTSELQKLKCTES